MSSNGLVSEPVIQGVKCMSVLCPCGYRLTTSRDLGFACLPDISCLIIELISAFIFTRRFAAVNAAPVPSSDPSSAVDFDGTH
jgi:hypothetical protein